MDWKHCPNCGASIANAPVSEAASLKPKVIDSQDDELESKDLGQQKVNKAQIQITLGVVAITLIAFAAYINFQGSQIAKITNTDTTGSMSSTSTNAGNLIPDIKGLYRDDWSACAPGLTEGTVTCYIGYTLENVGSEIQSISGALFYGVIDGHIFAADDVMAQDGTYPMITKDFNPGYKGKGQISFTVPSGAMIEKVFISSSKSITDAFTTFSVNLKAVA